MKYNVEIDYSGEDLYPYRATWRVDGDVFDCICVTASTKDLAISAIMEKIKKYFDNLRIKKETIEIEI